MTTGEKLKLRPDDTAPATARSWIDRFAERVPPAKLEDVRLVVDELVANAVQHAGLSPGKDRILLHLAARDGRLEGAVRDTGSGFEPPERPTPRGDMSGGWGLPIVNSVCSRWGTSKEDLFSVWFEISW